jgi:hypothetical protein
MIYLGFLVFSNAKNKSKTLTFHWKTRFSNDFNDGSNWSLCKPFFLSTIRNGPKIESESYIASRLVGSYKRNDSV